MNMPNKKNDWGLLSIFVDGELNADQEKSISERLKIDDDFNKMHEQIIQTRKMLADVPEIKLPRHFTLNEGMLPRPMIDRLMPRLSWKFSSAIASLLFVFIVIGDIFVFGSVSLVADQALPEAAMAMDAAEADISELAAAPEEMNAEAENELFAQSSDGAIEEEGQAEISSDLAKDIDEQRIDARADSNPQLVVRLLEIFFGVLALFSFRMGRRSKRAGVIGKQ